MLPLLFNSFLNTKCPDWWVRNKKWVLKGTTFPFSFLKSFFKQSIQWTQRGLSEVAWAYHGSSCIQNTHCTMCNIRTFLSVWKAPGRHTEMYGVTLDLHKIYMPSHESLSRSRDIQISSRLVYLSDAPIGSSLNGIPRINLWVGHHNRRQLALFEKF